MHAPVIRQHQAAGRRCPGGCAAPPCSQSPQATGRRRWRAQSRLTAPSRGCANQRRTHPTPGHGHARAGSCSRAGLTWLRLMRWCSSPSPLITSRATAAEPSAPGFHTGGASGCQCSAGAAQRQSREQPAGHAAGRRPRCQPQQQAHTHAAPHHRQAEVWQTNDYGKSTVNKCPPVLSASTSLPAASTRRALQSSGMSMHTRPAVGEGRNAVLASRMHTRPAGVRTSERAKHYRAEARLHGGVYRRAARTDSGRPNSTRLRAQAQ